MNRKTYTILLAVAAPLMWVWMAVRAFKSKTRWAVLSPGRFGRIEIDGRTPARPETASVKPVWVHAVSVGETRAAQPLIRALLARGDHILLTHTTPTGRQAGESLFAAALAEGTLRQAWFPYDFPMVCRRFLRNYRPRLSILIEREVWPNMIAACRSEGVPVALVSARLSERSVKRIVKTGSVLRNAYADLDIVCAQADDDRDRLKQVGATEPVVCGNLKFDVTVDQAMLAKGKGWRSALNRPVILLASTREGEDAWFAQAIAACTLPSVLFIWVPRHPQRFDEVASIALTHVPRLQRRTLLGDQYPDAGTAVYLGDTMGEMAFYYGASDVAVLGGSFAPLGGQNFIEACAAGVPVIAGPHLFNFQDAARDALAQGLLLQVDDASQAMTAAVGIITQADRQAQLGAQGIEWIRQHVGATRRILDALTRYFL